MYFFLSIPMILPRCQRQTFGHWEALCLSSSVQVLPLDVTTPRDSYTRNYRKLATFLTLSESLAAGGFEPLKIGSIRKNPTIEPSWHHKWKFSWGWIRTTDHRINTQESHHWTILAPYRFTGGLLFKKCFVFLMFFNLIFSDRKSIPD